MKINQLTPETAILKELGRRLARIRKARGFSQSSLAEEAGIGLATLQRIEGGQDGQIETWLKILKALDRAASIDALLPEDFKSPMAEVLGTSSGKRRKTPATSGIVWGDET
ncbi:MAG: helix-turn-helix transcriptional regulator [Hyphomicrobiales bacterium]|nr:helix-turn-helix transcriptional regulator [Hyphomicrobiales bacterium]